MYLNMGFIFCAEAATDVRRNDAHAIFVDHGWWGGPPRKVVVCDVVGPYAGERFELGEGSGAKPERNTCWTEEVRYQQ